MYQAIFSGSLQATMQFLYPQADISGLILGLITNRIAPPYLTSYNQRVYGQFCIEPLHESRKWKSNGLSCLFE